MKHDAFTLLELLVVITIIMVLVGFLIVDFNAARRFQELDISAQQTLAMMEQSRASVDSGRVQDDFYLCMGGYFEQGEQPSFAQTTFDAETETCDLDTLEESTYGLIQGSVAIENIDMDREHGQIFALFVPPEANLVFYNSSGQTYVGDGTMTLVHTRDDELSHSLNFSATTNQVTLAEDEEQ
jgi:type II secretory pathway pseudopilin PulG